jgi:hypothetical protein
MITEITSGLNSMKKHFKKGGKAINVNKTIEVLQGPDENPNQFYEWPLGGRHCQTGHF